MQRKKRRPPSDASLNGWNSYQTNNTTIRWSCKYRLINVSECKSSLKRSLENHQNPTAQATARATKWPINGFIHYTTDRTNDSFDIVISGYQWWCKSSLIATDSLTTYVVNLSVLAAASNMHAMPALHSKGWKNLIFCFARDNIFLATWNLGCLKKTIISKTYFFCIMVFLLPLSYM